MKRIILHWSAGGHNANGTDKRHYHEIIEGDGNVVAGNHPISANRAPIRDGYAAHTLNLNTDSIGLAVAAMRGSRERPFDPGPSPVTEAQVGGLCERAAHWCKVYGIPVTRATVLTHAEVQPTLGVRQRPRWDITWLPGMSAPGDPIEVGDNLRERIKARLEPPAPPVHPFIAFLRRIFGG